MIKQIILDSALRAPVAVCVERHAGVLEAPHIHERIGRPGIETERSLTRPQHGDIGDTPEIQDDPRVIASEHACMKGGNERRALPAGGDITGPEVGND